MQFLVQVFELSDVKPHEFVQYGLGCLEKLAALGDNCAKETREKIRVVVCFDGQINIQMLIYFVL